MKNNSKFLFLVQIKNMKIKTIYIIAMIVVAGVLLWEQTKPNSNVWIKVIGALLFFYGMMKLSAKTPSKNQENEE
jgi:hypothetical protein